jgi:hypothetical protein
MSAEWISLFERLDGQRDDLVKQRNLWRAPLRAMMTQVS